ncbi:MAG: FKBP-type peptidyl-prolyl cis-trans isomerase [Acidobacteriales bacterium]|nr:FKBP-type peptidyl-prolyl cis-trans isomerase [Terriglobales bacterium]
MRAILFLVPLVLMAQAQTPSPKAAPKKAAASRTSAVKKKSAAVKPKPAPAPAPLATDNDKIVYSIGLSIQRSLGRFDLSEAELALVKRGMDDGAAGKPAVKLDEWGPKIDSLAQARAAKLAEREKAVSQAYLDKAAAEPGAVKTPSGIIYREVTPGTGASPKDTDTVRVHYRGTLVNGTEFDSSYRRKEPAQFRLKEVIPCWTEGLQKMKAGGKSTLVCPANLAYGDRGRPPIPGGAALIFEVELLEIPAVVNK